MKTSTQLNLRTTSDNAKMIVIPEIQYIRSVKRRYFLHYQGTCSLDEFLCEGTDVGDGDKCIETIFVCDRVPHCTDGSDEIGCDYTCSEGQFK